MSKDDIALLADEIERKDLGNSGGNQDSFGSAIGGVKLITYHKGGGCSCERLKVPDDTLAQLERDSLMIYTGQPHLSGTIHADIKNWYHLENSPTIKAMDGLKAAAQRMAAAVMEGDLRVYVACLNASRGAFITRCIRVATTTGSGNFSTRWRRTFMAAKPAARAAADSFWFT